MNNKAGKNEVLQKALKVIKKNKYLMLLLLAGALLILWPSGNGKADDGKESGAESACESDFSLEESEKKLEEMLCNVDGAGNVHVMLTLKSGTEQVLAASESENISSDGAESGTNSESASEPLVIDSGDGEAAVVLKRIYPEYLGALIVAEGAGTAAVRLEITEAVSALTGLSTDKITVIKMKGS